MTSPSPNGKDLHGKETLPLKEEHQRAAEELKKGLREYNHQVNSWNPKNWAEHFRLLKEQDGQDYWPVLNWYIRHCSREEEKKLGLPAIASAKQFRACYRWIEGKFLKAIQVEIEDGPEVKIPVPGKKGQFKIQREKFEVYYDQGKEVYRRPAPVQRQAKDE